jgi:hypothetical protein
LALVVSPPNRTELQLDENTPWRPIGAEGEAWKSEKLSDEGVTITSIESGVLRGLGWNLMSDKETPFALDLKTGTPIPFARP